MLYSDNITAEIIYKERTLANMSQEDLADELSLLLDTDISRQKIGRWENGEPIKKLDELKGLAQIFNCEIGYLLGEIPNKTREKTDISKVTGLSEENIELLHKLLIEPEFKNYTLALNTLLEDRDNILHFLHLISQYMEVVDAILDMYKTPSFTDSDMNALDLEISFAPTHMQTSKFIETTKNKFTYIKNYKEINQAKTYLDMLAYKTSINLNDILNELSKDLPVHKF